MLGLPMTEIKRSIYSNKTVEHSIKTISSSVVSSQLIQLDYATGQKLDFSSRMIEC